MRLTYKYSSADFTDFYIVSVFHGNSFGIALFREKEKSETRDLMMNITPREVTLLTLVWLKFSHSSSKLMACAVEMS